MTTSVIEKARAILEAGEHKSPKPLEQAGYLFGQDVAAALLRAHEALTWYAGPAWEARPSTAAIGGQQMWTPIDRDNGERARAVVKELEGDIRVTRDWGREEFLRTTATKSDMERQMDLRKIDALVAEHIFGFDEIIQGDDHYPTLVANKDQGLRRDFCPSTSMLGAWEVVTKLISEEFKLTLEVSGFEAVAMFQKDGAVWTGSSSQAPRAICIAALAAKGIRTLVFK